MASLRLRFVSTFLGIDGSQGIALGGVLVFPATPAPEIHDARGTQHDDRQFSSTE
jgi:hypothetical protein